MQHADGKTLNREPNVVPMIDILLVLIISAMIPFLFPPWKAVVQLPVESSGPSAPGTPIVLQIAKGPRYTVNGRAISSERLEAELAAIYRERNDKVLFVDAARDVSYQDVFWVFGLVRGAGVTVTAIMPGTRRGATSTSPGPPRASAPGGT